MPLEEEVVEESRSEQSSEQSSEESSADGEEAEEEGSKVILKLLFILFLSVRNNLNVDGHFYRLRRRVCLRVYVYMCFS